MDANEQKSNRKRWDFSIIIAFVAVLISLLSTLISLKDSRIMLQQQQLLQEQQESSVWPYLEGAFIVNSLSSNKDTVTFEFIVRNKGIGPAIIDTVHYMLGDKEITSGGLDDVLLQQYPNLKVDQLYNAPLDGKVLSPGETHRVIKVKIMNSKEATQDIQNIINTMNYHLRYCYCSVYGKCWKVKSFFETMPSDECSFREGIR